MSSGSGVCASCQGMLTKKTFRQAWAKRGIENPKLDLGKDDCYQCEKCDMIYHMTQIEASDISLDETNARRKDFGFSHGREAQAQSR